MSAQESEERSGPLAEGLRSAVERTIAATAGTAAETAERAQLLLDEVARRGLEARDEVGRRGLEAREEVGRRGRGAREGLGGARFASAQELDELNRRLELMEDRLARLETRLGGKPNPKAQH